MSGTASNNKGEIMNFFAKTVSFYKKHDTAIIRVLVMLLFSLCLPILIEWVVRDSFSAAIGWLNYNPPAYLFTAVFFYFIIFFGFTIFRRVDFPILIVSVVVIGLGTASYFKSSYRSEPLYPWDLLIISEAADISSEMDLTPTASIISAAVITLLVFAVLFSAHIFFTKTKVFRKHKRTKKRNIQLVVQFVSSLAVLICYTVFVLNNTSLMSYFGISESAFRQPQAYLRNGFVQSFVMNTKYILPEKPAGYSEKSVNEIVSEISEYSNKQTSGIKPNIILLMSESYADISLCENVTYHDNIFVSTDFLKKHYVSGTLLGAQFGGGTCNSEFEVLTGFSMSYLPSGCTPYQQYFNTETVSYPRFLKSLGYTTVAIHSYGRQFWNRDVAYPNMGFDKFLAEESFVDPLRRRGLIKDDELVNKIIEEYNANLPSGKPFFNFSVSMQNHGAFTDGQYLESYRTSLSCDELTSKQEGILTTYATGIRDANIALDKLINYFSNVDEPTIICMFGDHLGSLGGNDDIYIKSGYMKDPSTSAEEASKKYTTPFFIWDNYTNYNFTADKMSFYQLVPSICSWYKLDRPMFYDYLVNQQGFFRGSALGTHLDADGNASYELSDLAQEAYKKHSILQYDMMFGKGYSKDSLYSLK